MALHEITFTRGKVTKNTVRFEEKTVKGRNPVVGTLYVQKWAAGEADEVTVTLNIPDTA